MKTSHTLVHKPEIEISLLIREALICIYLPLTLTPVTCRGQKCVKFYPHYMFRHSCTLTLPRLMKWKVSFLRVTLMSLNVLSPLFVKEASWIW